MTWEVTQRNALGRGLRETSIQYHAGRSLQAMIAMLETILYLVSLPEPWYDYEVWLEYPMGED